MYKCHNLFAAAVAIEFDRRGNGWQWGMGNQLCNELSSIIQNSVIHTYILAYSRSECMYDCF